MRLIALPAFDDNYIWALVAADGRAVLVDPGQAAPVVAAAADGLIPVAVLLTHHHNDHIGGVAELQQRWPGLAVYAPHDARIALEATRVGDGDTVTVLDDLALRVIATPGHTRSHIAFHGEVAGQPYLFSGDTLFSLGCGRMFEGTPSQMLASLKKLAALPGPTLVCCGHEYTLANAAFARHVDPTNAALEQREQEVKAMRRTDSNQAARPSVPVTLSSELACNPFLRTGEPAIQAAVNARLGQPAADETAIFAELRSWKDGFRA